MISIAQIRERDYGTLTELIDAHAVNRPHHVAMVHDDKKIGYLELKELMRRIAAALQREGVKPGEAVAICAGTSIEYGAAFLGILLAGGAATPLAPSSTAESLVAMLRDCGAKIFFVDASVAQALEKYRSQIPAKWVSLDGSAHGQPFTEWLAPKGAEPKPVELKPEAPFNIIYSSGTTGTPKGIVQSHAMRWPLFRREVGWDHETEGTGVAIMSTPLYSNTTLVSFLPTLGAGGTVVLMSKFEAGKFLAMSEKHRVTHAMLVPVQYQRLMSHPDFDKFDLSSFKMKFSTSAPFSPALKADVLKRWPGGLTEYYGMTEGGGGCVLYAHENPDKLHTVGKPWPDHDIRLIDESGNEVPRGEVGEIVGRSGSMMSGYHNQAQKTRDAEWYDKEGRRYIRTGDVGRFDAEGFLQLMDRKKDMIISGGFNVYPSDIEAVLYKHEAIAEAAVVGVASEKWGETPVAFVVLRPGRTESGAQICAWANERLGKTQRITVVEVIPALPRSHIGKILKRELRDEFAARVKIA